MIGTTIIARNYLPQAGVFELLFGEHHPRCNLHHPIPDVTRRI
jgi:hypothetical protein